jgi:S1-C subfamily serine protease
MIVWICAVACGDHTTERLDHEAPVARQDGFIGVNYVFTEDRRTQVVDVFPETTAERVGIRAGDVIVSYDGEPLDHEYELSRLVKTSALRHLAVLVVERDGKRQPVRVRVTAWPRELDDNRDGSGQPDPALEQSPL